MPPRIRIARLRWWMIGLIMLGSIINYLTRSTLAVAAPTLLADLHITTQQYSWILGAFQGAIMLQPICGYVLDVLGLKSRLRDLRDRLVAHQHGAWPGAQLAGVRVGLRGLLGFAEGSANPAGMKATSEWFPAKERGLAGGVYNIGASLGSMLAPPLVAWAILTYNWQPPSSSPAPRPGLGGALAVFYQSPDEASRAVEEGARVHRSPGRKQHLQGDGTRPSIVRDPRAAQFLGHRAAALFSPIRRGAR